MKDLVIVVADKNAHFALKGALQRPEALHIRPIEYEFRLHPGRDGGARTSGPETLVLERSRFSHGLLMFDLEGSGAEATDPLVLEQELDSRISQYWGQQGKAIVIAPEVDAWVWGADNVLKEVLDWPLPGSIRDWLGGREFAFCANGKPLRPKEALEALVPIHKQPRSSALYEQITSRVSLARCQDAAFVRLRDRLRTWFPRQG